MTKPAEDRVAGEFNPAGRLERHGVALAVAVGFVARACMTTALFDWSSVPSEGDEPTYACIAKALLETGSLDTHHFPVGYPLFVALFLKVSGGSFAAIRVAQILVGLLTIVVVSRIANLLYGRQAGVLAAWLTALYPPLIFMTGRIMSETLFIGLLMLSQHQFLVSDRDGRARGSAVAGGLFALASLVRSNLMPMHALVALWLLRRPGAAVRARLGAAVPCMAVVGGVLVLPGFYFLATKGEFTPFATNAGQTFYGEQPLGRWWLGAGRGSPGALAVGPCQRAQLGHGLQQGAVPAGHTVDSQEPGRLCAAPAKEVRQCLDSRFPEVADYLQVEDCVAGVRALVRLSHRRRDCRPREGAACAARRDPPSRARHLYADEPRLLRQPAHWAVLRPDPDRLRLVVARAPVGLPSSPR